MDRYTHAVIVFLLLAAPTFGQSIMGAGHRKVGVGGGGSTIAFLNTNTMQESATNSVTDSTNMSVTAGGSHKVVFLLVTFDGAGAAISSATYGGNSMTSCGAAIQNAVLNIFAQIFALDSPPTGLNTLVITGNGSITDLHYNMASFTGADTTLACPVRSGSYTTDGSKVADPSAEIITIPSDVNDLTISVLESTNGPITTNQTSIGSSTAGVNFASCDRATTAGASVTHSWSYSGNSSIAIAGLSIKHA